MALPDRPPFTLKELAERWRKSEDELLFWGANGDLVFHVIRFSRDHDFTLVTPSELKTMCGFLKIKAFFSPSGYWIGVGTLVVFAKEVQRMEEKHPELIAAGALTQKEPISRRSRPQGIKNRLTIAIEEAFRRLHRQTGRQPTTEDVFNLLCKDDQTGTVLDCVPVANDDPKLTWEDHKANSHDITYRTLANKISNIRSKNKKIP